MASPGDPASNPRRPNRADHRSQTPSDFVWQFYTGGGRTVTLEEIGHLREIAEHHAYGTGKEGAFRRLSDQIADAARESRSANVHNDFDNTYDFGGVAFSHGLSTIAGAFDGTAERRGDMISIAGETKFKFKDEFTDPIDLREFETKLSSSPSTWLHFLKLLYTITKIKTPPPYDTALENTDDVSNIIQFLTDLGGKKYDLTGSWTASFHADILVDRVISAYRVLKPR